MVNWGKIAKYACRRLTGRAAADRFYVLRDLAGILRPDYRFKWPQMTWWADESFNDYLRRFDETQGMNTDRRWMLRQLLRLVDAVSGDTAECGVFSGSSSYLICQANQNAGVAGKTHHMFDSFQGLSGPGSEDGDHWQAGDLACSVDTVRGNLRDFDQTAYYPGWIPDRFGDVESLEFSFVHVDVDLYQPTRDSIAFFHPRMSQGGIIVVDDYGFSSCPGATQAVDEFLADKEEQMLPLSGGGGFLIKGVRTSKPPQRLQQAA